jgi:DNA-binding transcriptional LysR family regulator
MTIQLTIDAIEVLDAIARKGSFAAAATALYRVPSAVTYTVRKLEDDLGILLFDRSGHRATLTPAGLELLNEGRRLLDAAHTLESRVKRIATGVETEIAIALSDLFEMQAIYQILNDFYAQGFGTRVKLLREVYGGSWDALTTGRANISIGAPGEGPAGGGYSLKLLGQLTFVFAVAPHHPLASKSQPLSSQDIIQYRAVAAADSSRNLPPRTSGILTGQDVLTVPDMAAKVNAQVLGLGVGYLPLPLANHYVQLGKLVIMQVAEPKPEAPTYLAWRNHDKTPMGKAQTWLLAAFEKLSLEQLLMK